MTKLQSLGMLIGRWCMSVIFLLSAVNKIMHWDGTVQYMATKEMTMIPLFLLLSILVELLGGIGLFLGYRTRLAATILFLYLIPVTGLFHDFWDADEQHKQTEMVNFLKNLAIFGGLFYVASCGAGKFAIDHFSRPVVSSKIEKKE